MPYSCTIRDFLRNLFYSFSAFLDVVKSKLFYFFVIYSSQTENMNIELGRKAVLEEDKKQN